MLTVEQVQECIDVLNEWTPLRLTDMQVRTVLAIQGTESFRSEIEHYGVRDTVIREQLMDMVVKYIGLPGWPIGLDSHEVKDYFNKNLPVQAKKFGIEFKED